MKATMINNSGQLTLSAGQKAIAWQQQVVGNRLPVESPSLVFLSGYRSDMTGSKAAYLAQHAAEKAYNYTRFDYRGHGQTGGHYAGYTLSHWLEDTLAVIDQLTVGKIILVGSSMGGWLMLRAAALRPTRIAALIGVAAAPDFVSELIEPALTPALRVQLATQGFFSEPSDHDAAGNIFTQAFLEDSKAQQIFDKPYSFAGPVRLLHGLMDQEVPSRLGIKLLHHIDCPDGRLMMLKDGDHRLSQPHHLTALGQTVDEVVATLAAAATATGEA